HVPENLKMLGAAGSVGEEVVRHRRIQKGPTLSNARGDPRLDIEANRKPFCEISDNRLLFWIRVFERQNANLSALLIQNVNRVPVCEAWDRDRTEARKCDLVIERLR